MIKEPCCFENSRIFLGDNNLVEIDKTEFSINNFNICFKMSNKSKLKIGKNFSCVGCNVYLHDEPEQEIIIGDDVMFSFDITIWPSDGHSIYDVQTQKVLNKPCQGIKIGNHVWVGRGVSMLKDSSVSDNTIIGACSIVTKNFSDKHVIIAGIPAKIIKTGVNWDRVNTFDFERRKNENIF